MTLSLLQLIAVTLLALAIGLGAIRLFLGPTTPDRVVAADTLAVITTAGLAGLAGIFDNPIYLDAKLRARRFPVLSESHASVSAAS